VRSYQDLRSEVAALGRKVAENAALRSEKESLESVLQAAHVKLAAFQEQRQALEARLSELNAAWGKQVTEEETRRRAAEKTRDEAAAKMKQTLGEFADLKERLAAALARQSELEGYIRRVRDEDRVSGRAAQGMEGDGQAPHPKIYGVDMARPGSDRTVYHWTDYGQHN